jgi:ABC-type transport system substrate-binding protein
VKQWLGHSDRELSDSKRLALIEKVGKQVANDVPMIPLFQRPTYFVYKTSIGGLVDNPTSQGPSWNVEKWTKK